MLSSLARLAPRAVSREFVRHLQTGATVAVCGLGSMGHGVVQLCASSGYNVIAVDMNQEACDKALSHIEGSLKQLSQKAVQKGKLTDEEGEKAVAEPLSRIKTTTDVADVAEADLIIEAIAENLPIKMKFFEQIGEIAKPEAIIATNTSSFSVSDMAVACGRPENTIGLHYFNPVQLMKLVEIVCPDEASQDVIDKAIAFVEQTKKVPVQCKDTPGFIVNRLLIPYLLQATAMVARGDATAEAVDTAMKLGAGHPMGPIQLCDYVGNDVSLAAVQGWIEKYPDEPAFQIPEGVALLEDMVGQLAFARHCRCHNSLPMIPITGCAHFSVGCEKPSWPKNRTRLLQMGWQQTSQVNRERPVAHQKLLYCKHLLQFGPNF